MREDVMQIVAGIFGLAIIALVINQAPNVSSLISNAASSFNTLLKTALQKN